MKRVALIGNSEGATLAAYFAATYPESTSHLIIVAGLAKFARTEEFPWGATEEWASAALKVWGTGRVFRGLAPDTLGGADQLASLARYERQSCSPGNFRALLELNMKLDVLPILPQIRVPTLSSHYFFWRLRAWHPDPVSAPHSAPGSCRVSGKKRELKLSR